LKNFFKVIVFFDFVFCNFSAFLTAMKDKVLSVFLFHSDRFHQAMTKGVPVVGNVFVNMFAKKTIGTVVSVTISFYFCFTELADKIFLYSDEMFWHKTVLIY